MRDPFSKIKTISELGAILKKERVKGKKIVLGHGVFDFLHYGHVFYLWQAKRVGDILIVSVLADKFVIKGDSRPVFDEITRAGFIASMESVDYVVLCQDLGPWQIISELRPDIYSKGEDSKPQLKDPNSGLNKDKKILKSVGGTLYFAKELPMHSSDVLNELVKKRGNNLSTVGASIEFLKKTPRNKPK
jgi:rfaE bifunctional protein nucleotidyltransferase chain/domain